MEPCNVLPIRAVYRCMARDLNAKRTKPCQGDVPECTAVLPAQVLVAQPPSSRVDFSTDDAQVLNPIVALTRLAASLHHENGTIAVPGFYNDVEPITPADEADMKAANLDEGKEMAALGAKGPFGEAGYSTLARRRAQLAGRSMLPKDRPLMMSPADMS